MARYTHAKAKICRRFGENIYGTEKYTKILARKNYAPGIHGKTSSPSQSEFGKQLLMKQKIRNIYGVLERQFRKYVNDVRSKVGVTGDLLMARLEMRLDNVVYRLGYATTRPQARQLVSHGAFYVNGRKVDVPSVALRVGDVVTINPHKKENAYFTNQAQYLRNNKNVPSWLQFNPTDFSGKVVGVPQRGDWEQTVDSQIVIEYYSK